MFQDLPHPVPPLAFLRYKENYFFIVIAPDSDVFGMAHLNFEPGFNRARFSTSMHVRGELLRHGGETAFPRNFGGATELSDGHLTLNIDAEATRFRLRFANDRLNYDLDFSPRLPAFDYTVCAASAPDMPSFQEVMTLGYNLPFNHMQQAMHLAGTLSLDGEAPFEVKGRGYRDHTWCVRSDNLVLRHTWSGLNFPDMAIGCMTIETLHRPGVLAREGYVADAAGVRPLAAIEVELKGEIERGVPETVVHRLRDIYGREYVVESDLAGRFAHVPLSAEKPDSDAVYNVIENFVRSRLDGGEWDGLSLVEVGFSSSKEDAR